MKLFFLFVLLLLVTSCTWEEFASGGASQKEKRFQPYDEPSIQQGTKCFDSDGGDNPTVFGELRVFQSGREFTLPDNCLDSNSLYEGMCNKGISERKPVACPYGCVNGACVKEATPSPEVILQQPFPVKVNGELTPSPIKRGEIFMFSWDATGLRDCGGTGDFLPLPTPQTEEGKYLVYWNDQRNLPSVGSMALIAQHKNLPDVTTLRPKVNCFDAQGNSIAATIDIPVYD